MVAAHFKGQKARQSSAADGLGQSLVRLEHPTADGAAHVSCAVADPATKHSVKAASSNRMCLHAWIIAMLCTSAWATC
jgi:hypothetical protein